ncbi:MAG TPA: acyl-CoA synthetase [Dehalococcoidia bacterium]|nr:acyl-CoA synthetase [Chloroflexota bacterium]MQF95595.1 AMP-binding protein [SAR202 cluster bacterium]HAA94739.1 acyl-CoA synthetase [Dehalococcoidia bacterium]
MPDYEKGLQDHYLDVPEFFNFGFDIVDKWADDRTKLALLSVDHSGENAQHHTFWDLKILSNKFANVLRGRGIKKGDRVFIMLPQVAEWYVAMLGLMKLGALPMPGTALLTPKDIEYRIQTGEAVMAITDDENAAKVEEAAGACPSLEHLLMMSGEKRGWVSYNQEMSGASPVLEDVEPTRSDDPLLIYFTSGTVGYPKMVLHTQASCAIGHIISAKYWHDLKDTDLIWTLSDTGWAKAAYGKLFGQWTLGAAVMQHDAHGRFDAPLTLRLLEQYGVTVFCAPPTAYRMMVLEDLSRYDLDGLRHCTGAGEPLNPEVMKQWEDSTGQVIYDGYGQTETVLLAGNFRCNEVRPGSMGKPAPGVTIGVVDEQGNEVPTGEEGQIAVKIKPERPVGLFQEYWRDAEAMERSFLDEWYLTGDKAYRDEDGYLWFVGRADDVIISAGYRIGPFEVESALIEHPAVAESAVVASPDPVRGEIVKAFVILAPDYVASDELVVSLQDHVRTTTAPYKYPRAVEFVTELPKTVSGKIRRVELRQQELDRSAG